MNKKNKKPLFIASFEDASILRKFTILFILASIIPMALLYYVFVQNKQHDHLDLTSINFTVAMILMVIGVLVGYLTMRSLLIKVINISKENSTALENLLSPQTIEELSYGENEIVILSRSFSALTKRLQENVHSLKLAKKTLHAVMSKIGHGISNMENIDTFLGLIVETMTNALNGKVGTLLLLNDKKTELIIHTVYGESYNSKKLIHLKLFDNSPLERVIEEKRPMVISGIFLQNTNDPQLKKFFGENLLCAPLLYHDRVSGIMTISKSEGHQEDFSNEDLWLVSNLASQIAVAIANSKINRDIEKTYFETISALALAVDAKDEYSRGHLDRVSDYALMIGNNLGLDQEDLDTLRDAARLHDLGKIGIPDEILKKNGPLSDEEWIIMRRHPEIGENIIKPIRSLAHLCDLIRHTHEKIDGSGYPDALKGDEVSPLVRILSVANVYDALTTEHYYRPKKSKQEAMAILHSMKDQLDQDIVNILLEELDLQSKHP